MATLNENINAIKEVKENIKNALIAKNVDTISGYPQKIEEISVGVDLTKTQVLVKTGSKVSSLTQDIDTAQYDVLAINLSNNFFEGGSGDISATINGTITSLGNSNGKFSQSDAYGSRTGLRVRSTTWINSNKKIITKVTASNLWSDDGCAILTVIVVAK